VNEKLGSDWNDLARLWQADAAAVSVVDIDAHLARHERQMRMAMLGELLGLSLGVAAAGWLVFLSPYRGMGLVVGVFALVSAVVIIRMRREQSPSGSVDVLQSLKDSLDREDWIAEQLRFGRASSFVGLFAIVQATASQLRNHALAPTLTLTAGAIAAACVIAALVWNLVLQRRSRMRRHRLEYLKDRLR
jgi:peptidoglycan/LPS O-acetylase OafA/YrhL